MRNRAFVLLLFIFCLLSCNNKNKGYNFSPFFSPVEGNGYFEPTEIVNKTNIFADEHRWVSIGDNQRIDGYTRIGDSIFGGEIACNIKPLRDIDISSFKICTGTQYAKDKKRVYYPITITCVDFEDCGVCFFSEYVIKDADPNTFMYLEKDYAKDSKHVYFRGEKIVDADSKTFKVIKGPTNFYFAKDKKNVYKHNTIFGDADASSFIYDDSDSINKSNSVNTYIIKDKNNIWEYSPPNLVKKIK